MFSLDGVSPCLAGNDPAAQIKQSYIAKIQNAFSKGFIKPYEDDLVKLSGWSNSNWLQRMKDFSEGKEHKGEGYLIACYLFAVGVSEDIDHQEKERLFRECLDSSSKETLKNFHYLFSDHYPGCMAATLLRYLPTTSWEEIFQLLFKYSAHHEFEKPLWQIMKHVTNNSWPLTEKQAFLDTLFERLPKEKANEVFFYLVLNSSSEKEVKLFLSVASSSLCNPLEALITEIHEFGEKTLTKSPTRIPFSGNQRCAFLLWFFENCCDESDAPFLAADFREKDWQFLQNHFPSFKGSRLSKYALKWVNFIATWLSGNNLLNAKKDSHLWLFFSNATAFIEKNKGWEGIDYKPLADLMSPEVLMLYNSAFNGEFLPKIIESVLTTQPAKIVEWMKLVSIQKDDYGNTAANKLEEILKQVETARGTEKLLQLIYTPQQSEAFQLTIFAVAPKKIKTEIIKYLFSSREEGLKTLAAWFNLCCSGSDALRPFVKDALAENLYKLVVEIDANLPIELNNLLSEKFKNQNEALEYLETVFPLGLDLNDPVDRSNVALKKFKRHFETPNIPHEDRRKFVSSVYKDLKRDHSRPAFVNKLFHTLEPRSWPLVFCYFDSDVCTEHYSGYYEEKSRCGTFQKTNKNAPSKLVEKKLDNKWQEVADEKLEKLESGETPITSMSLDDVKLWQKMGALTSVFKEPRECGFPDQYTLIDIASQALLNMIDNPLIDDSQAGWAMQHLYQVACETNVIHKIMQRFIEICPPNKFVPIVDRFAQAAFYYNKKALANLVADSFEDAHIDKSEFMADCLIAVHESGHRSYDLDFWKEPLTKTPEARAQVTRLMINKMQLQFLSLFVSYKMGNRPMIESLFATDSTSAASFFHDCLKDLFKANNASEAKFVVFQNLVDAFTVAEFNAVEQLAPDEAKQVAEWYTIENVSMHFSYGIVGWRLLYKLRPELCFSFALKKIKSIFSNEYFSFYDLENLLGHLDKLGLLEDLKKQIFEDEELRELIKQVCTKQISSLFEYSSDEHALSLILEIVPEWNEHLAAWSRDYMKKHKAKYLSYGSKPHYQELKTVVETLQKLNLYDIFAQELVKDGNNDLQQEIDRILSRKL